MPGYLRHSNETAFDLRGSVSFVLSISGFTVPCARRSSGLFVPKEA
jgi:hypothetical protein